MEIIMKDNLIEVYKDNGSLKVRLVLDKDNMVVTLKGFKLQEGHDDSLPYVANVYVNNKKIARAFNDGWGGESCLTMVDDTKESYERLREIAGHYSWQWGNTTAPYSSFASMLDELACMQADIDSLNKGIKKKGKDNIVAVSKDLRSYKWLTGVTKDEYEQYTEAGQKGLREQVAKVQEKWSKQGFVIMNENKYSYLFEDYHNV